jgi:hypothetical protein
MSDQPIEEVWDEILHRAAGEKDLELEAAVLGIALTIASVRFEDPEARELFIRGAAIVWRHTERFKAGEEPRFN